MADVNLQADDAGSGATLGAEGGGADRRARTVWFLAAVVTIAAALVPAVLWPGDASWMNDEPALIAQAHWYNEAGVPAKRGLVGSFVVPYGPLPTQVYQVMLLFTRDPVVLVAARAGLCSVTLAVALLWLARTLRLTPWFAAGVVLAPYVWLFNRVLWDATFVIPLSAVAVAAYASFLRTRFRGPLLLAVGCGLYLPLIHPQAIPLTVALAGHALWRHRPALRRHWVGVALVVVGVVALNFKYLLDAAWLLAHIAGGMVRSGHGAKSSPWVAATVPLRGGQMLAGPYFATVVGRLREPALLIETAKVVSCVTFALVWAGAAIAAWRVAARLRGGNGRGAGGVNPALEARDTLLGIVLAATSMQAVLYTVLRVPPWQSYLIGPFVPNVLFAWVALEALARIRVRGVVTGVYIASVAVITLGTIGQVHRHGWERGSMSATLRNQVDVAGRLNQFSDATVQTDVPLYQAFPHAIRSLRLLVVARPDAPPARQSGQLLIRFKDGPAGGSNEIELVELPADAAAPSAASRIDVTPLPQAY